MEKFKNLNSIYIILLLIITLLIIKERNIKGSNCGKYHQYYVLKDVEIREKKSMNSRIIGKVRKGEVVCVIDISNKVEYLNNKKIYWIVIQTPKIDYGYILSVYLDGKLSNSHYNNRIYVLRLTPNENEGVIEGSLSYPSEFIPDYIEVCAININTKKYYCTSNHIINKKYLYGKGYKLPVPSGIYHVFAYRPYDLLRANYYMPQNETEDGDEFCNKFTPVKVEKKKTVDKIDLLRCWDPVYNL